MEQRGERLRADVLAATDDRGAAGAGAVAARRSRLSASAGTGASIQSYTWSFGDGQSASGQSVSHVYATPGDYTVGLTVTDAFGNTGSTADQVAVVDTPGTTAGASGVSGRTKRATITRCGPVRHGAHGRESRRCTTTFAARAASRSHTQRRRTCLEVRAHHARKWTRKRCTTDLALRAGGGSHSLSAT